MSAATVPHILLQNPNDQFPCYTCEFIRHREYERRKKNAFKQLVEKACMIVYEENGQDRFVTSDSCGRKRKPSDSEDESDSFSSDNEDYSDYKDNNSMNATMANMYKRPTKHKNRSNTSDNAKKKAKVGQQEKGLDRDLFVIDRKPSPVNSDVALDNATTAGELTDVPSSRSEPVTKKVKKKPDKRDKSFRKDLKQTTVTLADVGGNGRMLDDVCDLLLELGRPDVDLDMGDPPPRGIILHGPPGCGKTLLAHAIAGELALPMLHLAATELVAGVSGESENNMRDIFQQAMDLAPCVMFIDKIDVVAQKQENTTKDMQKRIVDQLLTCMDSLSAQSEAHVIVIGATSRFDCLDPGLYQEGRFTEEICMGIPDEDAREQILRVVCKDRKLSPDFNFLELARETPGFVGGDLVKLVKKASRIAKRRVIEETYERSKKHATDTHETPESMDTQNEISNTSHEKRNGTADMTSPPGVVNGSTDLVVRKSGDQLLKASRLWHIQNYKMFRWMRDDKPAFTSSSSLVITKTDFDKARKFVKPSAMREGFATVPDVTWNDIGALVNVRKTLEMSFLEPVRDPEYFVDRAKKSRGVLLAGPPGCGKTLIAKAVANESGLNFISVKGPELLNMYVGESERAVRQVFMRARNSAPCVIFFDELDALCSIRNNESKSSDRVVAALLTEMDGVDEQRQVYVMAATNRPDMIDPAVLRPGRLGKTVFVDLPNEADRCDILRVFTRNGVKRKMADDVDLKSISARCDCYTGADLESLVDEAAELAYKEFKRSAHAVPGAPFFVRQQHFDEALKELHPSVSTKDQRKYERLKQELSKRKPQQGNE